MHGHLFVINPPSYLAYGISEKDASEDGRPPEDGRVEVLDQTKL